MAILQILHHPDPRLREVAQPVTDFGAKFQTFVDDLFDTMYDAPGVGLAATQVGVAQRVAVMDCSKEEGKQERMVMVNPEILDPSDKQKMEEGCLSVPGVSEVVERYSHLKLKALDRHGQPFELEADELLAQAVQHEIDHLDGKLYIDMLSGLKRERINKKLRKMATR